jgi:hypothetical protein
VGAVEDTSWDKYEGSFYGYKIHMVMDTATELPVAIGTATGGRNDSVQFVSLLEEVQERYDVDGLEAVFGDAGFDRHAKRGVLGTDGSAATDLEQSAAVGAAEDPLVGEIEQVFEEHGDESETTRDSLELLPKQLLSDYDVEVGNLQSRTSIRRSRDD